MLATEFKKRLFQSILDLLWRQWSQLGIPGQIISKGKDYVLDPEMLLLFSANFCRFEPRLYDLIIDWLQINGDYINLSRLKSLLKKSHCKNTASLGFMAHCVTASGSKRWKRPEVEWKPAGKSTPEDLFLSIDNTPIDFVRIPDQAALEYGFKRNAYKPSGKAMRFSVDRNASFLLQLRGAFGLSARAETVLALLNKEICKIQDIAAMTGFSWKSTQDAVGELCASGLVVTAGYKYYLKDPQAVLAFFGKSEACFPDWVRLYNALAVIWDTVSNPLLADLS